MIPKVRTTIEKYRYPTIRATIAHAAGPNSNTFIATLLQRSAELGMTLLRTPSARISAPPPTSA